ncbi:hypothetical protein Pmar_PMAR024548 [Perkinsus marinus ATCC 50983]|uniref:Uncharacterized protein n=1 Tax=Perkinsus marinus (strain ATCC 50983 / TXsc) TaxID=423536 RepID=C5LTA3_PERM5|nr:hypothetical protein Pmar_PMAR024548 [Perkinsus marinus ATCC 50983]EER00071.1 hypothetical protein Pmar_PMAR024548 [Perkinsus marinus ATCC 50983]|eukprot:XP_002767353.1 hypothetical protein Pmar_PMAR024548 [Perkinsus marinus ATCC 50983]
MPLSDEYWNLRCTQHKDCKVQLRVILITPPLSPTYKVNVFRNPADHSHVLRGDPGSGFKTVKVSDYTKQKMHEALEAAYFKLTPTQLYQRFLAPICVHGPLPETPDMISQRQKLKRYCENLKRNHQKKVRALCLDTINDFVRATSDNEWDPAMWSEAREILESGNHLQPAMIRLKYVVGEDNFAVCIACSASVVSAFNLQNITKHHIGITLNQRLFLPIPRNWYRFY